MLENLVSGAWNAIKKGAVILALVGSLTLSGCGEDLGEVMKNKEKTKLDHSHLSVVKEFSYKKRPNINYSLPMEDLVESCDKAETKHNTEYEYTIENYKNEPKNQIREAYVAISCFKDSDFGAAGISLRLNPNEDYQTINSPEKSGLDAYLKTIYTVKIDRNGKIKCVPIPMESMPEEEQLEALNFVYTKAIGTGNCGLSPLRSKTMKEALIEGKRILDEVAVRGKTVVYRITVPNSGIKVKLNHNDIADVIGRGVKFNLRTKVTNGFYHSPNEQYEDVGGYNPLY